MKTSKIAQLDDQIMSLTRSIDLSVRYMVKLLQKKKFEEHKEVLEVYNWECRQLKRLISSRNQAFQNLCTKTVKQFTRGL